MRPPREHSSHRAAAAAPANNSLPTTELFPNKSATVTYPSANGKSTSFVAQILTPEKGSASASKSTVQNRSKLLERVIEYTAVPPSKRFKAEAEPDRIAQLISIAKRDLVRRPFATAATAVGAGNRTLSSGEQMELAKLLKYACVTLSDRVPFVIAVVGIVGVMCSEYRIPTVKWRNFNSYLLSHGIKALAGNDKILRTGINGNSTRYEAGTTDSGIPFFRCTDIVAELEELVADNAKAGRLNRRLGVTNDALRVTVMMDKGGGYTKAFITVWDVDQGLSPLNSVFMGWYQGQDNHDSVYAVFGDALGSLEIAAAGINWPYQYTSAAPVTNDESVRAFLNHPAVQRDRKQCSCQPTLRLVRC